VASILAYNTLFHTSIPTEARHNTLFHIRIPTEARHHHTNDIIIGFERTYNVSVAHTMFQIWAYPEVMVINIDFIYQNYTETN